MKKNIGLFVGIIAAIIVIGGVIFYTNQNPETPSSENGDVVTFENIVNTDFAQYIKNNEDNVTIINNMSPEKKEEIRQGITIWQERQDGTQIEPYLQEATLQSSLGNHDEALAVLAEARELFSDSATIFLNIAAINRQIGRYLDAANAYAQALEINDDNANTYLEFGDLLVKFADDTSIAGDVYRVGLQKTDEQVDMLKAYASYLDEELDDQEQALEYWQKALAKTQDPTLKAAVEREIEKLQNQINNQ